MNDNKMLHKIGLDSLTSLAIFTAIFGQVRLLFHFFAFDPSYIPIVSAMAAAISGALVGRVFDLLKERYLDRKKRKPKRLSQ